MIEIMRNGLVARQMQIPKVLGLVDLFPPQECATSFRQPQRHHEQHELQSETTPNQRRVDGLGIVASSVVGIEHDNSISPATRKVAAPADATVVEAAAGEKNDGQSWKCDQGVLDEREAPVPLASSELARVHDVCDEGGDEPDDEHAEKWKVSTGKSKSRSEPYNQKREGLCKDQR